MKFILIMLISLSAHGEEKPKMSPFLTKAQECAVVLKNGSPEELKKLDDFKKQIGCKK